MGAAAAVPSVIPARRTIRPPTVEATALRTFMTTPFVELPGASRGAVKRQPTAGKDLRSSLGLAEFRILGPVEAVEAGATACPAAPPPRAPPARLLLRRQRGGPAH